MTQVVGPGYREIEIASSYPTRTGTWCISQAHAVWGNPMSILRMCEVLVPSHTAKTPELLQTHLTSRSVMPPSLNIGALRSGKQDRRLRRHRKGSLQCALLRRKQKVYRKGVRLERWIPESKEGWGSRHSGPVTS